MKLKLSRLFIILVMFNSLSVNALEPLVVQGRADDTRFSLTILKAAIKRGNKYNLEYYNDIRGLEVSEMKLRTDLLSNKVDLIWTLTSAELEEKFAAIYIPIYRGMTGMRIALVRNDRTHIFDNVKSINDLNPFKAGQGKTWADTQILEHNQINVVKTLKYNNLFPMLEGGRFDYFPRGLPEPWAEIKRESQYNLVVEPNLLFKYVAPLYFFTHPENKMLNKHITDNLEAMIADGTFEKMFFSHNEIKETLVKANVENRLVIPLENPSLSKRTPLKRNELWFDPSKVSIPSVNLSNNK